MEIRNLITFLQVAERKNFTHAANALNYSQSTVSSQIKQLEEELGSPLFERIHNKVALTERGEMLRYYAQQIVNITNEMQSIDRTEAQTNSVVRFAMAPSICSVMMGETYMNFHKMYPDIAMKIISTETEDMLKLLSHNDVDLIFIVDRHSYNKDSVILSEKKEVMHFVAGRKFDFLSKRSVSIDELIGYPFLLTEKGVSYRKLLDEKLAERYAEITPIVEMGDTALLMELIKLGAGISFLPDYITRPAYESGEIVYVDVRDFDVEVWRQLICHKNKWLSPSIRKVSDYCSEISNNM